ncbi:MAG: hypothetical protein LAO18_18210 [Acidobacteriia bacterium]|nr:hypothetical protein [Terriglobia bacterium]
MPMKNMQLFEFADHFPVKEYRISDEKIEARILDGGPERIEVETGDVVLLPAEKPHAVKATTRFKMVLTMIRS